MQHKIPIAELGPAGEPMAEAVQKCVHCGFCLPACPTYHVMGEEMDSPRGRIYLMKEVLEGSMALEEAAPYIDHCLGCVACETACPSGVDYGSLLTPFRGRAETLRRRRLGDRLLRVLALQTLPVPWRFRWAARLGRLGRPFRWLLPGRLRGMLDLLPSRLPSAPRLPELFPAEGPRRARVALLAGCAQQVLEPDINWATLRVLARNGVEVVVPRSQRCCGALMAHTGSMRQARRQAVANLSAFPDDVDAVLTNAAGCGSGLHEYPLWLRGSEHQQRAERLASRAQDVTVFLDQLGCAPAEAPGPTRVAYHDACHLAHAQRVRAQPRRLLQGIANLQVLEISDSDLCCGSAGIYNIEQPHTAALLGQQKAQSVMRLEADLVATGNIGCMMQLQTHLRRLGSPLPVLHTMQVLDRAYRQLQPLAG